MDLASWAKQTIRKYDPGNPAASFGEVFESRFPDGPAARQLEIESLCAGKLPGFGYWVLAHLILSQPKRFGLALTTNFDDLIADAVYLRSGSRPLVISHPRLARLIPFSRSGPLVIKLHGDRLLAPKGTPQDTTDPTNSFAQPVGELLRRRGGLIVIGYGGGDEDVVRLLRPVSLPWGVFWCNRREPGEALSKWLEKMGNAFWVNTDDFDELMLMIMDRFELKHPNPDRFGRFILDPYFRTYGKIGRRVHSGHFGSAGEAAVKSAFATTLRRLPSCEWKSLLTASWANPDDVGDILDDGLESHPRSPGLNAARALWLLRSDRQDPQVTSYFLTAKDSDPEHIDSGVARARHLAESCCDDEEAAREFERLSRLDPLSAAFWARYAEFVERTSPNEQGYQQAEGYYRRALRADVYDAEALGLYASFLGRVRRDAERADKYFSDALALDNGSQANLRKYAAFLASQGNRAAAEDYYGRALHVDNSDPTTLGAFAAFLAQAEPGDSRIPVFIQTALDLDPRQKDAFELCHQAFDADPANVSARVRYASALLARGAGPKGREVLEPLVSSETAQVRVTTRALRAECWFLALVYFPESLEAAIRILDKTMGAQPPLLGRTLRTHLKQAQNNHLLDLFTGVAAVLVGTQTNREVLDDHDEWRRTRVAAGA